LEGNPLESPPPEVVNQGTKAILAYLRALSNDKERHEEYRKWESKLLILGEADCG